MVSTRFVDKMPERPRTWIHSFRPIATLRLDSLLERNFIRSFRSGWRVSLYLQVKFSSVIFRRVDDRG